MKKVLKVLLRWIWRMFLLFFIISIFWVLVLKLINPPVTWLMLDKWATENYSINKQWVDLEEISPHLPLAVIAAEDQNFFNHYGFDLSAIEKAVEHNKNATRKRGASTISQQVAKNVFLWPNRSWARKGLEVYFTGMLELFWSKERILEVYLNVIELGPGIYGAEKASEHFFKKTALKLTRQEAALLAAVLPNPVKFSVAKPSTYVQNRKKWILSQMNNLGDGIIKKD